MYEVPSAKEICKWDWSAVVSEYVRARVAIVSTRDSFPGAADRRVFLIRLDRVTRGNAGVLCNGRSLVRQLAEDRGQARGSRSSLEKERRQRMHARTKESAKWPR